MSPTVNLHYRELQQVQKPVKKWKYVKGMIQSIILDKWKQNKNNENTVINLLTSVELYLY